MSLIACRRGKCSRSPRAESEASLHMASTYAFIGLGIIGGSIAKALRKYEPDCRIMAYMRTRSRLELARSEGVVDTVLGSVGKELGAADIIFLCAPVEYNRDYLALIKPFLAEGTILTDVGSTKAEILKCAGELGLGPHFIGGHPMAGSEKTGYENSDPLILENAYYMLCPSEEAPEALVSRMTGLVSAIRAIPFRIEAELHDRTVATISHLPHLIAAALVNLVEDTDSPDGVMRRAAAGGFKDITRIASGSPVMWEQICRTNREAIISVLDRYMDSLKDIRAALKTADVSAVHDLFEKSGAYRKTIDDDRTGFIDAKHSFSVYVADRPGSISILAAILAAGGISIRNIGINHSREAYEGALRVSFYDGDSRELAEKLLKNYGYMIGR